MIKTYRTPGSCLSSALTSHRRARSCCCCCCSGAQPKPQYHKHNFHSLSKRQHAPHHHGGWSLFSMSLNCSGLSLISSHEIRNRRAPPRGSKHRTRISSFSNQVFHSLASHLHLWAAVEFHFFRLRSMMHLGHKHCCNAHSVCRSQDTSGTALHCRKPSPPSPIQSRPRIHFNHLKF